MSALPVSSKLCTKRFWRTEVPKYYVEVDGHWVGYDSNTHEYYEIVSKKINPKTLTAKELSSINDRIIAVEQQKAGEV
jgi:hypothetical protein